MSTTIPTASTITIRTAYAEDQIALARLAALDSAELPPAPMLLGDVDGELRAALSLSDGSVLADPFFPTSDLIALLRVRGAASPRPSARRRSYRFGFA